MPGVKTVFARYGLDVTAVHVGLALARPSDLPDLARQHADNDRYRQEIEAAGGHVLLGELHKKPGNVIEEKMVDCSCCVRITRYVDEILLGSADVEGIVVLSKDIDLRPAVDYALEVGVPILVAASDVIQHRGHPFILLGPNAYAELTEAKVAGHEIRELLTCALYYGTAIPWKVAGSPGLPVLVNDLGLVGLPVPGLLLPPPGATVSLCPVDVTWNARLMGTFPMLVCDATPAARPSWEAAKVRRRPAPMTLELSFAGRGRTRAAFPLGGVVPGETVLVHASSRRVLGRLVSNQVRSFDPDEPVTVRVASPLPAGGAIAANSAGVRGLLTTDQTLTAGDRMPAAQVNVNTRGPVWAAIGTPLPR